MMGADGHGHGQAAALLQKVKERLSGDHTTLGEVLEPLGERGPGFPLLILAVPAIVPTPGLPLGLIFGTVLALTAMRMMVGRPPAIPGWITRRRVRREVAERTLERAAAAVSRLERRLRPRLPALTRPAAWPLLGLLVLVMGVLIALPIPFGNTLPGLAVIVVALGLMMEDGLAVAAGAGLSAAALAVSALLIGSGYLAFDTLLASALETG